MKSPTNTTGLQVGTPDHPTGCAVPLIFGTATVMAEGPIRFAFGTGASTPEPPPTPGTGDVWQSVIERLPPGRLRDACVERRAFGLRKYGAVLQANNGRDWRKDALQEALDGVAYAAQGVAEGDPEAAGALERAIAHAETVVRLVGGAA